MSFSCEEYKISRRAMLGASGATLLGMQVSDLLAFAGKDHAQKAEHVILFWNGGGMTHLDTWDPTAVFIDARTNKPPPDLVEGVGFKTIQKHEKVDFDEILGSPVTGIST